MDTAPVSAAPEPRLAETPAAARKGRHSYGEILESLLLIGGSSALSISLGVVRTKAMALLLGPSGFGLLALYGSVFDMARCIAGMGVNSSGVRQIAAAVGSGRPERIAQTITVMRRTVILLGVIGAVALALLAPRVSTLTFGSDQYGGAIALLSLAVVFRLVADGQAALMQGLRRIADLAKLSVLGALFGTLISIPVVYVFREDGIVPYLIAVAAMAAATAWWYSHKIRVEPVAMTVEQVSREAGSLLKLGFSFMASSLLFVGSGYVIRIIVTREIGLEAAGFYQAAWALAGLYVGFVHEAMGADFYPRLVAVAEDNPECCRLVNEQARVSMLLAGPGVIATLTFAPFVLGLLYSSAFHAAQDVLRWICLGMALRVVTWPMGFIIIAKGRQFTFLATEFAWAVVSVALAWNCVRRFGLDGAGMAFAGSYAFHWLVIYPVVRRLSGFRWSPQNRKAGLVFFGSIALVLMAFRELSESWAMVAGSAVLIVSSAWSLRVLLGLVSIDQAPPVVRRLLSVLAYPRARLQARRTARR